MWFSLIINENHMDKHQQLMERVYIDLIKETMVNEINFKKLGAGAALVGALGGIGAGIKHQTDKSDTFSRHGGAQASQMVHSSGVSRALNYNKEIISVDDIGDFVRQIATQNRGVNGVVNALKSGEVNLEQAKSVFSMLSATAEANGDMVNARFLANVARGL